MFVRSRHTQRKKASWSSSLSSFLHHNHRYHSRHHRPALQTKTSTTQAASSTAEKKLHADSIQRLHDRDDDGKTYVLGATRKRKKAYLFCTIVVSGDDVFLLAYLLSCVWFDTKGKWELTTVTDIAIDSCSFFLNSFTHLIPFFSRLGCI